MTSSLTIPISTSHGEYFIKLTAIDPLMVVSKDDSYLFANCTIYDILLVCKHRDIKVDMEAMTHISAELQRILNVNPNIILYFFCDFDSETITIRPRCKKIPPQEFRSRLFSLLFDRAIGKDNRNLFINRKYVVNIGEDGNVYIHLIFPEHLTRHANLLASTIENQSK